MSTDVLLASQMDNALNCIGLKKDGNRISRKEMKLATTDANSFIKKLLNDLKNNRLKIEPPEYNKSQELTQKFIIEQLEKYQILLERKVSNNTDERKKEYSKKISSQ